MERAEAAAFQKRLAELGYRFQFVTLAGFHSLNHGMFRLAPGYAQEGMGAYSDLQQEEFAAEAEGFTAVRHQREAGTSWFDTVALTASGGAASTTAMADSTETEQFGAAKRPAEATHWAADGTDGAMPVRLTAPAAEDYDDGLVHGHAWALAHA